MHSERVTMAGDGRVVIPAAARRELGLAPGQELLVESDGVSLYIRPYADVLRETQAFFRQFAAPGVSEVDALIEDRRAEARREAERDGAA